MKFKNFLTCLVVLLCGFLSFAQNSSLGLWAIYFGNQTFSKNWNWWTETQYRSHEIIPDTNQFLVRTGIGYNLTENNNNILLGYAFIHSENYQTGNPDKIKTQEHRIYQQFITRQQFNRFFIQHRYRLEQRFFQDDFRMRLRYFLALNYPLNKEKLEKNAVYLSAYNEIFLNTEPRIFDRNRIYGGLGYSFSKNTRLELGYMNQSLENKNTNQMMITLINNINLQ